MNRIRLRGSIARREPALPRLDWLYAWRRVGRAGNRIISRTVLIGILSLSPLIQLPRSAIGKGAMLHIQVNFDSAYYHPQGWVELPTDYFPELIELLRPGLRVLLWEEGLTAGKADITCEAIVHFDDSRSMWFAEGDISTIWYAP